MDYKKGRWKINISKGKISFSWNDKAQDSFDLNKITSIKLEFLRIIFSGNINKTKGYLPLADITQKDYKAQYVSTGQGGGTITYPNPVAVFYSGDHPLFYIDFNRGPGKEKPLLELMKIVGERKFEKRLLVVKKREFQKIRDRYSRIDLIMGIFYIFMMTASIVGIFWGLSWFFNLVNNVSGAVFDYPDSWIILIFLPAIILFPLAIVLPIYHLFINKKSEKFVQENAELVRASTKSVGKWFNRLALIGIVLVILTFIIIPTSYYVISDDSLEYYFLWEKRNEYNFSGTINITLECIYHDNKFSRMDLIARDVNSKAVINNPFTTEQTKAMLDKVPEETEFFIKCPEMYHERALEKFSYWGKTFT